jgi:sugar/nucleoside kinase (ribokinase family)
MALLVAGSVAIDRVDTPFGRSDEELGGSAVYFSFAASRFTPVRMVGIVGEDFPDHYEERIGRQPVDTEGLCRVPGRTFRWHGAYEGRMAQAETREVELNVFAEYEPRIPQAYRDSRFVFLANASPVTHMHILQQVDSPAFSMADTMNLYIGTERDALLELMKQIDALIINDAEVLMLSEQPTLLAAADWVLERGPEHCIIKKGEHGAMHCSAEGVFTLPALPTQKVLDPTGAGDSFAGGFMGYLAREAADGELTPRHFRRALAYGTVTASFALEHFGPWTFEEVGEDEIGARMDWFLDCTQVERSH